MNPSLLFPPSPPEGFHSLLLNQLVNMEEGYGDGHGDGCQEGLQFTSSEESSLLQSEEESSPPEIRTPNFNLTFIGPLNVPVHPEGEESAFSLHQPSESRLAKSGPIHFVGAAGAEIQGEPFVFSGRIEDVTAPFILSLTDNLGKLASNPSGSHPREPFHPPFQELIASKEVKGELHDHSPFQSGRVEMASDGPLLTGHVSKTDQRGVSRMNILPEELISLPQIGGKDAGNRLTIDKVEVDGHRVPTSFKPLHLSLEEGRPNLTSKPELLIPPHLNESGPGAVNDSHRSATLNNDSSHSDPWGLLNRVGPESKMERSIPEETPKGQNGSPPKTEPFEIYQQVGRKIAWALQHREERIKLTLDPPNLGSLYMEVTKEREIVKATLWAESPATKGLLDTHRAELRRVLEEDGFKLERFDVFVQQEPNQFPERRESSFLREEWKEREIREDRASLSSELTNGSPVEVRQYSGMKSHINRIV